VVLSPRGALRRARTAAAPSLLAQPSPSDVDMDDVSADKIALRPDSALRARRRILVSRRYRIARSGRPRAEFASCARARRWARSAARARVRGAGGGGWTLLGALPRGRSELSPGLVLARERTSHPARVPRTARTQTRELD
jgi:hypothetical protein